MRRRGPSSLKKTLGRLKPGRLRHLDEIAFLKTWVDNPLKTGAIAPSGSELAASMAAAIGDPPHGKVLELGPGTGSVTRAILAHGVPAADLTVLEYSAEFCRLLALRHPAVQVVKGDAYRLVATLTAAEALPEQGFGAIVSSLPLLNRPEAAREALIREALAMMPPGAPFIQFSYGWRPPVRPVRGEICATPSSWIFKNLPPARVWTYRAQT